MKTLWIVLGIVGVLLLLLVGSFVGSYNKLVTFEESIKGEWAQVENQLKRRSDLIPNLVNTVKGYAKHEKDVFIKVTEARSGVNKASTVSEKINANAKLESALSRLLVVVERYPALKANQNFIRLQDELSGTENRIAVARKRYNDVVRAYNIIVKRFPSNIVAMITGFEKNDAYFKIEEKDKEVPNVKF